MIRVVSCITFLALVSSIQAKGCIQNNNIYMIGASWVYKNTVCLCHEDGSVTCEKARPGLCDLWGDPHFTSYDGRRFDFQGICRYVLSRDCCDNSWSIEVELKEYSATTSVTDKFTIRFGSYVVELAKVNVLNVNGIGVPTLFWDDAQLRCEMVSGWMMVTLKGLGVWFRWNWWYHAQVYVSAEYKGELCGLCADFNGNPANDLSLTPTGEPVDPVGSISAWGETWRTKHQPDHCKDIVDDDDNCEDAEEEMKLCEVVMFQIPEFDKCRKQISPELFIEDCRLEMCECSKLKGATGESRKACICHAVSGYVSACEAAGFLIAGTWQKEYGCGQCERDTVFGVVVYDHGQSYRDGCVVITCDHGDWIKSELKDCCKDGDNYYEHLQTWVVDCDIRICIKGEITHTLRHDCCFIKGDNNSPYLPGSVLVRGCENCVCSEVEFGQWNCHKTVCVYKRKVYSCNSSWTDGCLTCKCNDKGEYSCVRNRKCLVAVAAQTKFSVGG